MKWCIPIFLVLLVGCTATELTGVADAVSDPNVTSLIVDVQGVSDIGAIVKDVGTLTGSTIAVAIGTILVGIGSISTAIKKRKD